MRLSNNKTTLYNIASTIALQGMTFVSGPVFSKILGTSGYGISSVYLTWVSLSSIVFSLHASSAMGVAIFSIPEKEQSKYQSSIFSLFTISYLVFSVIIFTILLILSNWREIQFVLFLCGLVHGWGMYCINAMNTKLIYEYKADKNFVLSMATSVISVGISLILVHFFPTGEKHMGYIYGQTIVYFLIGFVLIFIVIYKGKTLYNKEYWRFSLPITIPTVFHSLSLMVLNQSDKIMLQNMIDNSTAGIYALSYTFSIVIQAIWGAFNNSWVPNYYEYTKNDQLDEIKKHSNNYIEVFTGIVIGFILLSREVFQIYAHEDYWLGTELIPLLAIGHYFVFLYSFPVNYEFYNKKTKMIATGTTVTALCNIVLNYFFIKQWGIIGAVIATVVSQGLLFSFHFILVRRIKGSFFPYTIHQFIPGLLCVLVAYGLTCLTKNLWYIRWGLGAMIGILLLVKIIRRRTIF